MEIEPDRYLFNNFLKEFKSIENSIIPDASSTATSTVYVPHPFGTPNPNLHRGTTGDYTTSNSTSPSDVTAQLNVILAHMKIISSQQTALAERLDRIEKVSAILSVPTEETLRKWEALRDSYEAYKAAELFFLTGE